MRFSLSQILASLALGGLAGLFGTWCMDQAGAFLRKREYISGPPPVRLARWFAAVRQGRIFPSRASRKSHVPPPPISYRNLWLIHYGIGLALGVAYGSIHLFAIASRKPYTEADRIFRAVAEASQSTPFALQTDSFLPAFAAPAELFTALAYGISTSIFAWFLLFPGMGYGAFGARAPARLMLMRTSLINHAVYGLSMGAFWLAACALFPR